MSRVLKRPMFKLGGSTGEGITSGLSRRGYKAAGSVDWGEVDVLSEQIKNRYGAVPRQGYNVWDFLTEWGLNMASSPPMGNVLQTAAGTAREPYSKMVEGKGKDEMAQYMANMASTDKALAAVTDIEVAKQKNQNLKDENEARAIGTIQAQVLKENPNPGTFGNSNAEMVAWGRYKIRMLGQTTDEPIVARVIEGDADQGGAWALNDNGVWDYDVSKLHSNIVWLDPLGRKYIVVEDTDKDGYGNGEPKEFSSYGEAIAYLNSRKPLDNDTTTIIPPPGVKTKKEKLQDLEKEKESFVYSSEDFMPKYQPDAWEIAAQKSDKALEKEGAELKKWWDWLIEPKGIGKSSKKPPMLE